jgi:hypothetical protein
VPNEKLMTSELLNITQSASFQDRIFFEVDARRVNQEMIDDLSDRVQGLIASVDDGHYFDQDFEGFTHIASVKNPLKYEVRFLLPGIATLCVDKEVITYRCFC